jgi:hypothetical protein
VKAIQKARKLKQGKVGIVAAESLNKKDVESILSKLHSGAIIIEKASRLNRRTVEKMCEVMEGQTGELLVVLEDERKPLEKMLEAYPQFSKKFTSRLELPVFINDELVTFGQTYAKENGYKIDEMGILALYSRIDMLQRNERVVTVADVKDILDDAIENAQRASVKKFFKKLTGKNTDDSDRIILSEEDFENRNQGVYLTKTGIKKVVKSMEEKLEKRIIYKEKEISHREIILSQVEQYKDFILGKKDDYVTFFYK